MSEHEAGDARGGFARVVALGGALVAAAGCASSAQGPAPEDACRMQLDLARARQDECGAVFGALRAPSETPYYCTRLAARVAAGVVGYDGARAAACLDRLTAASCLDLAAGIGECAGVFSGTLAEGAACLDSAECAGDGYCERSSCPGTCLARQPLGKLCGPAMLCQSGLACSPTQGVCVTAAAVGEPCPPGVCGAGLACAGGVCVRKQIAPPGAPCRQSADCGYSVDCHFQGGYCDFTFYCDSGACHQPPANGEACGRISATEYVVCADGYCGAAADQKGTCAPFVTEGGTCNPDALSPVCAGADFCNAVFDQCQKHPAGCY
jgi:hypothetical protein